MVLGAAAGALVVTVAVAVVLLFASAPRPEPFEPLSRPHEFRSKRSSCYSCETAFPPGEEWRGQPSKCFSCEADVAARGGDPFAASRSSGW